MGFGERLQETWDDPNQEKALRTCDLWRGLPAVLLAERVVVDGVLDNQRDTTRLSRADSSEVTGDVSPSHKQLNQEILEQLITFINLSHPDSLVQLSRGPD